MAAFPLSIAFATRSVPMTGATPWERDLGGSESAMVFVARALAARGHDVQVFTLCERPGDYDGVRYDTLEALDAEARVRDWDVFVSLRFPDLLLRDVRAALRILWCQDVLDHLPVEAWLAGCDRIVVVSDWHRERTLRQASGIAPRISVIRNPADLDLRPSPPPPRGRCRPGAGTPTPEPARTGSRCSPARMALHSGSDARGPARRGPLPQLP